MLREPTEVSELPEVGTHGQNSRGRSALGAALGPLSRMRRAMRGVMAAVDGTRRVGGEVRGVTGGAGVGRLVCMCMLGVGCVS